MLEFWQRRGLPQVQKRAVAVTVEPRAAASVPPPTHPFEPRSARPELALAEAAPPPFASPEPPAVATPSALELTVPLHVTVRLGDAGPARLPGRRLAGAAAEALERVEPDPDDPGYQRRAGYDPGFLGFAAPLPRLADDRHGQVAAFGDGDETEVRYHHFSVVMNARRRLAYLAAVNLLTDAPFHHEREGWDRWFYTSGRMN